MAAPRPSLQTAASLGVLGGLRTPAPCDLATSHCRVIRALDRGALPEPPGGCLVTHGAAVSPAFYREVAWAGWGLPGVGMSAPHWMSSHGLADGAQYGVVCH